MKATHLNLLQESERLSSSPVRLRVMLPVFAMLACAGMLVWWLVLTGRALLAGANVANVEGEIAAHAAAHAAVTEKMQRCTELELELDQLDRYRNGRRAWGQTLTSLAEVMPLKVQLTKLEIPQPPPQILTRPKGEKGPPLWGPTNATDDVLLVLSGRAPKETPVISLMESLGSDVFTNALTIVRDPTSPLQSPKVKSFRQDVPKAGEGSRMLAFEIEYRAKERRFEP